MLEGNVDNRNKLAEKYKTELSKLPGIKFQKITPNCRTTFKDFSIYVEPEQFGLNRDELCVALAKENIMTRKYFYPPLHKQRAYAQFYDEYKNKLPVTDNVSSHVLSLPLFSHMEVEDVVGVSDAIENILKYVEAIKNK